MNQYAVLLASGPDRPGLVDEISEFILACGCNMEDSRMAILGGEFAMLILVSGDEAAIVKIIIGVGKASDRSGLMVQARRTRAPSEVAAKDSLPYEIEAFSMDHPGIVHCIASFLAQRKINVRALDTRLTNAPITGLPLFALRATVDISSQQNVAEIRRGLEALAAEHNIDIEMKPVR
jgi:glycine cleavage system transcriptional repressor